jgi:hypothetical protein
VHAVRIATTLVLLLVAACGGPQHESAARPAADGWYAFEGSWIAAGQRRFVALGPERRASALNLSGALLLAGPARPGIGFHGEIVGMADTATGLVGRAAWTDERGEQVFSELSGEGTARGNRITGTFVGGTGRYAGATGGYEFSWQYVLENEDGTVQGRAVGLKGRVRFETAAKAGAR